MLPFDVSRAEAIEYETPAEKEEGPRLSATLLASLGVFVDPLIQASSDSA
jgi:hypothetical protein